MVSLLTGHDMIYSRLRNVQYIIVRKKMRGKLNFLWNPFQRHSSLHLIDGEIDTKVLNKVYKHKVIFFLGNIGFF